jgi:hypothetical protein
MPPLDLEEYPEGGYNFMLPPSNFLGNLGLDIHPTITERDFIISPTTHSTGSECAGNDLHEFDTNEMIRWDIPGQETIAKSQNSTSDQTLLALYREFCHAESEQ